MTNTKVTKTEHTVEIQVDTMTYLFTPEQYSDLYLAMTLERPDNIVWQSTVTAEDVSYLSASDIEKLVEELDHSVFLACDGGGVY
jgi:non-homologous end joining protein Ku